jgi:hypothetical protein
MLAFVLTRLLPVIAGPPPTEIVAEPRTYEAVRTTDEMTIDGKANESVWKRAFKDDRFTEREPVLGRTPPLRTTLQVAYDDFALYILVEAQADPDELVNRNLRRDIFAVFADDNVALKLDPHHDHRSAHTFAVNIAGAQFDSITLEDGRVSVSEWDSVWAAEVTIHDRGFTVEFRIPFAILGIKAAEDMTMGLDLARDSSVRNATYDWRLVVPPRHPVTASAFGDLVGIKGVQAQRALEFTPFAVARTDFTRSFTVDPRLSPNLAAGADARLQVGAGSYVEASVLTDFAQVEVDQVQVARDRFPLFFPERRPFFINGLDVFNFGRQEEAQLFFSRRIGLDSGRPIPILGGAKAYGRQGPVSYGLLNVQTLRAIPDEDEVEEFEEVPPENFSVGRVRVQTSDYTSVGVLGVGKHRFQQESADAFSGGFDVEIRALKGQLRTYGFVAASVAQTPELEEELNEFTGDVVARADPAREDTAASGYATIDYQGLFFRPSAYWLWSDEQFQAPLGFYRRPGTAQHFAEMKFAPRPTVFGLRDIQFGPAARLTTTPDYDQLLTTRYGTELEINWQKGWKAEYEVGYVSDFVQEPFELYLYEVEAKEYQGFRNEFSFESPRNLAASTELNYQVFNLFNGLAHQFRGQLSTRFSKHLSVGATYTHLLGHLESTNKTFNFGFLNGNLDVAVTRNIIWDNLVRMNFEPGGERFGLQSRFRWRYMPGSDLFLVYRMNQPLGLDPIGVVPSEPFHSLTLKATFYLRALLKR